MKPITRAFLLFQIFDIIVTFVAVSSGIAWELNPLGFSAVTVVLKIYIAVLVCIILEAKNFSRAIWVLPAISATVVAWNFLVVVIEIIV